MVGWPPSRSGLTSLDEALDPLGDVLALPLSAGDDEYRVVAGDRPEDFRPLGLIERLRHRAGSATRRFDDEQRSDAIQSDQKRRQHLPQIGSHDARCGWVYEALPCASVSLASPNSRMSRESVACVTSNPSAVSASRSSSWLPIWRSRTIFRMTA